MTASFEEQKDSNPTRNHMNAMEKEAKEAIVEKGKMYNGVDLDGELYPPAERLIVGTHKGPMLAKFRECCPTVETRHVIKKINGDGKSSLTGTHEHELEWFTDSEVKLRVCARSGRGDQGEIGWTDKGIDYGKAGSLYSSITEWLPDMGISEVDAVSMAGVLDALASGDNYTMLFVKAVLTLRMISVGYTVEETEFMCTADFPRYMVGNKKDKVGVIGDKSCTIDLDVLGERERFVALLCSMPYPSINCKSGQLSCIYERIAVPACDVKFVCSERHVYKRMVPSPEKFWKSIIGLACKLGAVDNLVTAFRVTRGWASFTSQLAKLGVANHSFQLDCPPTTGARSVLMDSNMSRVDTVVTPTNLACSVAELVCDWACGVEMASMFFHLSDEFALANKELNRNVSRRAYSSVGDSMLREAGFYDYGDENSFYTEMRDRFETKVLVLGDEALKRLIRDVGGLMMAATKRDDYSYQARAMVREVKNMTFTAYYGPLWSVNATSVLGFDMAINSSTWGATAKERKPVFEMRNWMDLYGLSDKTLVLSGYNAIQKMGVEAIEQEDMKKISGANGIYCETYREVGWISKYRPRVGTETVERDRLEFMKTYLAAETIEELPESPPTVDEVENETEPAGRRFRGSLGDKKKEHGDKKDKPGEEVVKPGEGEENMPPEPDGEKEKDKGKGKVTDPKKDVTGRLNNTFGSARGKPSKNNKAGSYNGSTVVGAHGFDRDVALDKGMYLINEVPGEGYCVIQAIASGMREIGRPVTDEELYHYAHQATGDRNWFDINEISTLLAAEGIGLVVYDIEKRLLTGIGTEGMPATSIVGITFSGKHCDSISRVKGRRKIPGPKYIEETDDAAVMAGLVALFNSRGS